MASKLTSVVIGAKSKHTATVFWLHGLGDSGAGWSFLADQLSGLFPYVKWVLPNAPAIPITLNGGMRMPGWFDLTGLDKSSLDHEDRKGMESSVDKVKGLIQEEIQNGIPSERIVVGGFSQGCAIALLTALKSEEKFAGIVACSGWLAMKDTVHPPRTNTAPILMCHGDSDPVVRPEFGRESAEYLKQLGYNLKFNMYPNLGHSADPNELRDIATFIRDNLPDA